MTWSKFKSDLSESFILGMFGFAIGLALLIIYIPYFIFYDVPRTIDKLITRLVRG